MSGVPMDKKTFGTLFQDNKDGEGANPSSKVCPEDAHWKGRNPIMHKVHKHQAFDKWVEHILA